LLTTPVSTLIGIDALGLILIMRFSFLINAATFLQCTFLLLTPCTAGVHADLVTKQIISAKELPTKPAESVDILEPTAQQSLTSLDLPASKVTPIFVENLKTKHTSVAKEVTSPIIAIGEAPKTEHMPATEKTTFEGPSNFSRPIEDNNGTHEHLDGYEQYVEGEYFISFNCPLESPEVEAELDRFSPFGLHVIGQFSIINMILVRMPESLVDSIAKLSIVDAIEKNAIVRGTDQVIDETQLLDEQ
jgi:hypothetical protein